MVESEWIHHLIHCGQHCGGYLGGWSQNREWREERATQSHTVGEWEQAVLLWGIGNRESNFGGLGGSVLYLEGISCQPVTDPSQTTLWSGCWVMLCESGSGTVGEWQAARC